MGGDQVKEKNKIVRKEPDLISEIKPGMERKEIHEKCKS